MIKRISTITYKQEVESFDFIPSVQAIACYSDGSPKISSFTFTLRHKIGDSSYTLTTDVFLQLIATYSDGSKLAAQSSSGAVSIATTHNGKNVTSIKITCSRASYVESEIYKHTIYSVIDGANSKYYKLEASSAIISSIEGILNPTSNSVTLYQYDGGTKSSASAYLAIGLESSSGSITFVSITQESQAIINSVTISGLASPVAVIIRAFSVINIDNTESIDAWSEIDTEIANGNLLEISKLRIGINYAVVGPAGAQGPMLQSKGIWSSSRNYIRTSTSVDYVLYAVNGTYSAYYVKEGISSIAAGILPTNTSYWVVMNNFKNIATDILLANFALIAGAVFYDNKLMSQAGLDGNGAISNNYGGYPSSFTPNVLIDWLKGVISVNHIKEDSFMLSRSSANSDASKCYHIGGYPYRYENVNTNYTVERVSSLNNLTVIPINSLNILVTSDDIGGDLYIYLPIDPAFIGSKVTVTSCYRELGVVGSNNLYPTVHLLVGYGTETALNGNGSVNDFTNHAFAYRFYGVSANIQGLVPRDIQFKNGTVVLRGVSTYLTANAITSFDKTQEFIENAQAPATTKICEWAVNSIEATDVTISTQ